MAILVATALWTAQVHAAGTADPGPYAIPAQPLPQALAAFARISGVDIFYEAGVANGHRSAPVDGQRSDAAALSAMLEGTGLRARFTGPKAAIIYSPTRMPEVTRTPATITPSLRLDMAQVRAPLVIGRPNAASFDLYAAIVQRDIRAIFNEDPEMRRLAFRMAIAIRVDRAGRIHAVEFAPGQSEQPTARDIRALLLGRSLSESPPEGLHQPFRLEVSAVRASSPD